MRLALGIFALFLGCLAFATGAGYLINHVFLGEELFLVIDLLLGGVFGMPLFAVVLVLFLRRRAKRLAFQRELRKR